MTSTELGTVSHLYRFPVKSLIGERCDQLEIEQRGAANDRRYAIKDVHGKLGSHKTTRRFRRMNGLFTLQSKLRGGTTWILFPDGTELLADDPAVTARLSELVGHPVTLEAETSVSHFDDSPIHIVTSASLSWLENALPNSQIDPRRFRPNIVIACEGNEPLETHWLGRTLRMGTCEFEIVSTTERCLMPTLAQQELPPDPEILSTLSREAKLLFGVYAKVLSQGLISVGDSVSFSN